MTDWSDLTRMALKARVYERETWFREGLADAERILGDEMAHVLRGTALVLIKPDGLVSGRASVILGYLQANDFSIIAVETPLLMRFHWRELWRYQLTSATLDRLAVNDLVLRDRALLLLLRSRIDRGMPAAVWLSSQKGPSDLASQSPDCLRALLRQPNRIFSFLHVADEPADIVRELAIILEPPQRQRMLAALVGDAPSAADQATLGEVIAASDRTARVLDASESLRRVEEAMQRNGHEHAAAAGRIARDLARMRAGERIEWRPFADAVAATRVLIDPWDIATLAATFIVYDEPGAEKLIKRIDSGLWRDDVQPS